MICSVDTPTYGMQLAICVTVQNLTELASYMWQYLSSFFQSGMEHMYWLLSLIVYYATENKHTT